MKLIKSKILFDGTDERKNVFIGFEGDEIKHVGMRKIRASSLYLEKTL